MVAEHDHRAIGGILFDQVEHGHRIRAVTDQVAEKCVPLSPQCPRVYEACANGLQIAVNVGEHSQLHGDRAIIGSESIEVGLCGERH